MHDQIDQARENFLDTRDKSFDTLRAHYTRLIEELRAAQRTDEENLEQQSTSSQQQLDALIDEHKQQCEQIHKTIQELRTTITDWSTIEQFKHLQNKLTQIQEEIHQANENFHRRLPERKSFDMNKDLHSPRVEPHSHQQELLLINGKQTQQSASSTGSTRHPLDGQ